MSKNYKVVEVINNNKKNMLINGDNLDGMSHVEKKLQGKVDIIYIDPPYNTRKKMGKYSDNFGSHAKWADFMRPRLEKSVGFLSETGLIFISIGEDEMAYLKVLADTIFGENNFVANIIWQSKYTVSNDKNGITSQTEYILVYAKDISKVVIHNDPLRQEYVDKTYKNIDNDERGPWRTGVQLYKKKNPKSYTVVSPTGKEWTMPWNYNEEGWKKLEKEKLIWWGKDGNSCPQKKVFLKDSKGRGIRNLWLGEEVGYTADGGNVLEQILGDRNEFAYPKPVSLIKRILTICGNKNSIVMDFFAGSGTTGHAVMEKNKEDGGKRKFILITNDDNEICSKVALNRLKKVISGYEYKSKSGITVVSGINSGFQYIKLKELNNEEK